jgi:hypothetical protein
MYSSLANFRQAFHCIRGEKLERALLTFGMQVTLVKLTKATMTGTPSEVKIQAELTDIIFTRQRLKRGD